MEANRKPRLLCVDDEIAVLQGLEQNLRRRYEVHTCVGAAAALECLRLDPTYAVIVSDMRMPGMDGATFLARARQLVPETVRLLLTGMTDFTSAIKAVNEGNIFRFLEKPCPLPTLTAAIDAAIEQHQLVTGQRVLLAQTLHGAIKTLTDVLSMTSPHLFGRANRIKRRASEIMTRLGMQERWQIEVAAMLSQLGSITLPPETAEKLYYGVELSAEEHKMVAQLPAVTEQLLGNIPRLEVVRGILSTYPGTAPIVDTATQDTQRMLIRRGAAILRAAVDHDALEAQGESAARIVDILRSRSGRYDEAVLGAFAVTAEDEARPRSDIRELPLSGLRAGMVFAREVKLSDGRLLVARGFEVTVSFLERLRNLRAGSVVEPLRVVVGAGVKEG